LETPEQKAKSQASTKVRKTVGLPLKVKVLQSDDDEYKKTEKVTYEMAIRQYISGKDVPIKEMQ